MLRQKQKHFVQKTIDLIGLDAEMISLLAKDPRFACSNPAESMNF
jgi:hypothetical protein